MEAMTQEWVDIAKPGKIIDEIEKGLLLDE